MCGTGTRTDRNELTIADRQWKQRVIESFDRASSDYDRHAQIQRYVASQLASVIADRSGQNVITSALEIGCGTGFLTRSILELFPNASWTISDVSPAMVNRCKTRVPAAGTHRFQVLDGECLHSMEDGTRPFDLICSNLAFQWFADLPAALSGIMSRLQAGGFLFFSTLAEDNFSQVYSRFSDSGLGDRAIRYPGEQEIRQVLRKDCDDLVEITKESIFTKCNDLGEFLNSLKEIGAATSRSTGNLDSSRLRSALVQSRQCDEPMVADYRVMFVAARKRSH